MLTYHVGVHRNQEQLLYLCLYIIYLYNCILLVLDIYNNVFVRSSTISIFIASGDGLCNLWIIFINMHKLICNFNICIY